MKELSKDASKAAGFCSHGNLATSCEQCKKESEANLVTEQSTEMKDGFPIINSKEFEKGWLNDMRETEKDKVVTFDYQGFIRDSGTPDDTGHRTEEIFYMDTIATHGILRGDGHKGISVKIDGIISERLNHQMKGPKDVGEYVVCIGVPAKIQKDQHCVVVNDSCIPEDKFHDYYGDEDDIEGHRKTENFIIMILYLDPKEDNLARKKAQFIQSEIIKHIENGVPMYEIEGITRDLEKKLEKMMAEEFENLYRVTYQQK